jgi:hypothetical protein
MTLHIFKCLPLFSEEDEWNRFLLEPLEPQEHLTPDFSQVEDRAVYVVLGVNGLAHVPEHFLRRLREMRCKGLFHIGDEFFSGGYELYRHFDFVIRPYYASAFSCEGIKAIPLGYPLGMAGNGDVRPASQRPWAWSFLGGANPARMAMVSAFRRLEPNRLHVYEGGQDALKLSRAQYKDILESTVFVPCPMGNVLLETRRVYEALEAGAIPLVSRRTLMPYHDLIMPGHPIPTFKTWSSARRFASDLLETPAHLDSLQRKIVDWWRRYKETLQAEVCAFVSDGFAGAFRSSLSTWQAPSGLGSQIWRVAELLKHHDLTAVKGRCETMLERLYRGKGLVQHRDYYRRYR